MCGIVGAVAQRDVGEILLEGLRRLEYRGYDSAGISIIDHNQKLNRIRVQGKVTKLCEAFASNALLGSTGIAHTRWATHGEPSEVNAHPHQAEEHLSLVHNGIVENHEILRNKLLELGYEFQSQTDTETIVYLLAQQLKETPDFVKAVRKTIQQLVGAFALGIIDSNDPKRIIAVRYGSPLVIGLGIGENFIASDNLALLPVTQKFIYLEDGDIADIRRDKITIYDKNNNVVQREIFTSELTQEVGNLEGFRHFMLKEIFEQADTLRSTLEAGLGKDGIAVNAFGPKAEEIFAKTEHIQIVACGTSYNAGLVAKHWIEELAGISCQVEIASEIRYRKHIVLPNTLFIVISQSGETADTLAALRQAKEMNYVGTLAICNVPESSIVRETDLVFITRAGREIGVASTKAFTNQLLTLFMLTMALSRNNMDEGKRKQFLMTLKNIPSQIEAVLRLNEEIRDLAKSFADKQDALFLGRGIQYPIAMEGALKLKEISYIHAESYPAGELKHGPLALVDEHMPVVVIAPNNNLLEKLKSNIQEVKARGGQLIIFTEQDCNIVSEPHVLTMIIPKSDLYLAPIVYTVPLQLLAYHVALIKGTDVDHPRNLAKAVTVE